MSTESGTKQPGIGASLSEYNWTEYGVFMS